MADISRTAAASCWKQAATLLPTATHAVAENITQLTPAATTINSSSQAGNRNVVSALNGIRKLFWQETSQRQSIINHSRQQIVTLLQELNVHDDTDNEKANMLINFLLACQRRDGLSPDRLLSMATINQYRKGMQRLVMAAGDKMLHLFTPEQDIEALFINIITPLYAMQDKTQAGYSTWLPTSLFLFFAKVMKPLEKGGGMTPFLHNLKVNIYEFNKLKNITYGTTYPTLKKEPLIQRSAQLMKFKQDEALCKLLRYEVNQLDLASKDITVIIPQVIEKIVIILSYINAEIIKKQPENQDLGLFIAIKAKNIALLDSILHAINNFYEKVINQLQSMAHLDSPPLVAQTALTKWQGIPRDLFIPYIQWRNFNQLCNAAGSAGLTDQSKIALIDLDAKIKTIFGPVSPPSV